MSASLAALSAINAACRLFETSGLPEEKSDTTSVMPRLAPTFASSLLTNILKS